MRQTTAYLLLAGTLGLSARSTTSGVGPKTPAPEVLSIGVPYYPAIARASHVEGSVQVEVTTDGHGVKTTRVTNGDKLLAKFAEANARTWTFVKHAPTKFIVTYDYKLVTHLEGDRGFGEVVLHPPDEIEVSALPVVVDGH